MSKDLDLEDLRPMPLFEALKKLNRVRLFEGILGYCLVTLCLVCGFVYLDRAIVYGGVQFPETYIAMQINGLGHRPSVDFLGEGGGGCDLFDGNWVWDDTYPLYQSRDCAFLDSGFRCSENVRSDLFYTKWRWQPKECNLPRGCYFQEGDTVKTEMNVEDAYRRSIETVLRWIHSEVNTGKTQVFSVHMPPFIAGTSGTRVDRETR